MTNRNTRTQRSPVLLVALVVLAGCRPGLAEDQDKEQLRTAAEQRVAGAQALAAKLVKRIGAVKSQ